MIVYVLYSHVSLWTIEWFGRLKLILTGSASYCLSIVVTFARLVPSTPTAAKGATLGLSLYIAFFGATYL
jgi:hypothetical protein